MKKPASAGCEGNGLLHTRGFVRQEQYGVGRAGGQLVDLIGWRATKNPPKRVNHIHRDHAAFFSTCSFQLGVNAAIRVSLEREFAAA